MQARALGRRVALLRRMLGSVKDHADSKAYKQRMREQYPIYRQTKCLALLALMSAEPSGRDNSIRKEVSTIVLRRVIESEHMSRQRDPVLLYYYENMKQKDIAALWKVDQSAISRHITRRRRRIKRYINCLMCLDMDYFAEK